MEKMETPKTTKSGAKVEEKKTRFVVYDDDFFGHGGRRILGYVNTLAEAQELLAQKYKELRFDNCKKMIDEIYSHTEDELVGRDELTLYGSNCYFHDGIARVAGYVDKNEKEPKDVTLGEILKHELADVNECTWEMKICEKKDQFYLQIHGRDKVFVGTKYERIVGLPTHRICNYFVYTGMGEASVSEKDFPDMDWTMVSVEEVDSRLKEYFLSHDKFYSKEDAVNSLPNELILDKRCGGTKTIAPYDKYGYHIEQISAYSEPCLNGQGVFIHIKR